MQVSNDFSMIDADTATDGGSGALTMSADGDTALPDQVAYLPNVKPGAAEFAAITPAGQAETTAQTPQQQPAATEPGAIQTQAAETDPKEPAAKEATAKAEENGSAQTAKSDDKGDAPAAQDKNQVIVTATDPDTTPAEPKKRGFLAAFFGSSPAAASPAKGERSAGLVQVASVAPAKASVVPAKAEKPQAVVQLSDADDDEKPLAVRASLDGGDLNPLPGVRQTALFEIKRKSGLDDDSDVDLHEDEMDGIQLASAAGLARLAPNGLLKQTERVDVACLKPALVRVLKTVERHYGRTVMVTSGYRSREHNRRARGAKNSLHMYCAAADVQVQGISKWELANFVRSMPGRGGVGTYCHTNSVHIDVGPERDWNWRCRRRT
ncbi:MAG: D-Ala-D-Ala carboxypeptidase family metallohydrolase [Mesorhizobium sp.]|jgi:uncharacterized protein YcbK (DUF882 family)